jgi:hypothetical protein
LVCSRGVDMLLGSEDVEAANTTPGGLIIVVAM